MKRTRSPPSCFKAVRASVLSVETFSKVTKTSRWSAAVISSMLSASRNGLTHKSWRPKCLCSVLSLSASTPLTWTKFKPVSHQQCFLSTRNSLSRRSWIKTRRLCTALLLDASFSTSMALKLVSNAPYARKLTADYARNQSMVIWLANKPRNPTPISQKKGRWWLLLPRSMDSKLALPARPGLKRNLDATISTADVELSGATSAQRCTILKQRDVSVVECTTPLFLTTTLGKMKSGRTIRWEWCMEEVVKEERKKEKCPHRKWKERRRESEMMHAVW